MTSPCTQKEVEELRARIEALEARKGAPHSCPICGGVGTVRAGFYMGSGSDSTNPETCRACSGTGIIWAADERQRGADGMSDATYEALCRVRAILNNHVHGNRTRPEDINEAFHIVNRLLLPGECIAAEVEKLRASIESKQWHALYQEAQVALTKAELERQRERTA